MCCHNTGGMGLAAPCCVTQVRVPWFLARGYISLGEPKQGRRYRTQVMVRADLLPLAGRIARIFGEHGN